MIYLIEDKTSRRNDYGWTNEKISTMSDVISVIENATKLIEMIPEILTDGNVVLFHESFSCMETNEKVEKINDFISQIVNTGNVHIAFFSGSNSQRLTDGSSCSLNVDILYTNLDIFIEYYRQGTIDFNYLLFGEDPKLEARLLQLIQKVNNDNIETPKIESDHKILFFQTSEEPIQVPMSNAIIKGDCDYDCSDTDLAKLVEEQSAYRYDAIYIPLCMGETLSDYLGLRLAMFFKLSDTANKYAHIFIYGVVNSSIFLKNECVEVLKMPGVNYVLADAASLIKSTQLIRKIKKEEYRLGLKSIHLNVPTNIGDNHSIANKWAISRWSLALGDSDEAIQKNNDDIYSSLYFRYLSALYPPKEVTRLDIKNLLVGKDEKNVEKGIPDLNILYVDDEADEGWYELLCNIIYDENNIDFDYVGHQLKSMTETEIVNHVMKKIKSSDANVVILDLRLHSHDFNDTNIKDITGYKLLKEIKQYNRGIQVLMFSATNKIWNLQALQKAEVDGFIMKEAPEISNGEDTITQSICQLVNSLSECSKHTYRKSLWKTIQNEKEYINKLRRKNKINLEYAKAVEVLLTMTEDALFSKNLQYAYATAFMNLFRIIEATANEWIDPDVVVEVKGTGKVRSYFKLRKDDSKLLKFNTNEFNANPKEKLVFDKDNPSLPYFQKICNTLHVVRAYNLDAFNIVAKRNNFTHPNLIENDEIEKFTVKDVLSVFNLVKQIIMNQQFD